MDEKNAADRAEERLREWMADFDLPDELTSNKRLASTSWWNNVAPSFVSASLLNGRGGLLCATLPTLYAYGPDIDSQVERAPHLIGRGRYIVCDANGEHDEVYCGDDLRTAVTLLLVVSEMVDAALMEAGIMDPRDESDGDDEGAEK